MNARRNSLGLLLALLLLAIPAEAQEDGYSFRAKMIFGSAFIHALPSTDAAETASIFEDNLVDVVGRNIDGVWFEVRRPGRSYTLGWMLAEFLEYDEGLPERLPLTDLTTGWVGASVLTRDPGFATYAVDNLILRDSPVIRSGRQIGTIPAGAVLPVLYRNHAGTWLFVNYRGSLGWVATFNTRPAPGIESAPVAPGLAAEAEITFEQIPPEVQRAQIARLRDYLYATRTVAVGLENLWYAVVSREIMPCEPPDFVRDYPYTADDSRQFPELERYVPRLDEVGALINAAIEPLTRCGVFDRDVAGRARNAAINARVAIDATLAALILVEERIR
ncbi:MAG: SH3 domain-containing protein [Anaerolineae bacterium]|nr:SH3 domain-containing protein [Anaerolineae bacterium]NUQ02837.1 SH3 domain-containing protein [Anaerolineae bacterium]